MGCRWVVFCYCSFAIVSQIIVCNSDFTEENILEKWEELENNLQIIVDGLIARLQPVFREYFSNTNISSECKEALNVVVSGVQKLQTWALKFIDSSGRPMPNVMSGSFSAPGLFDECVGISVPEEVSLQYGNKSKLPFRGQYCSINFRPPLPPKPKTLHMARPLPEFSAFANSEQIVEWGGHKYAQIFYIIALRFGACLPSTCSERDVKEMVDIVAENTISLTAEISHCEVEEYNEWTKHQVIAISILAIPFTLSIVGTCVTFYLRVMKIQFISVAGKARKTLTLIVESFSVYTNVKKIVDTKNKDERLSALHGLRTLSFFWVVLSHTYAYAKYQQITNMKELPEMAGGVMIQIILNGTLSVDAFFFMSGLLVMYIPLEKLTAKKKISIPFLVFHRVWRLWPPLLTTILLTYFLPWTGSGPHWHETMDPFVDNCKSNWWATMVFINNFIHPEQSCLLHTWYVCTDFQLYLFATVSLVILLRRPVLACVLNAAFSVIGMIVTGYFHWAHDLPPILSYDRIDTRHELMLHVYFPPYVHIGVYCIGMTVGYFLHKRKQLTIKPIVKCVAWITALTCNLTILFASLEWNRGSHSEAIATIAYATLHRNAWAIALGWLVVACCTGNCEILRKFLSWGAFVVLSRLTFFAYLLHFLVINVVSAINRQSFHAEHMYGVSVFFTNLTLAYMLAFVASLLIESPLLAMEKILYSRRSAAISDTDSNELSRVKRDFNDKETYPSITVSRF